MGCPVCRGNSNNDYAEHEASKEHIATLQDKLARFVPGSLVCKACYVAVNSTESWKSHCKGSKHTKAVTFLTKAGKDHKWELPALYTKDGLQFNESKESALPNSDELVINKPAAEALVQDLPVTDSPMVIDLPVTDTLATDVSNEQIAVVGVPVDDKMSSVTEEQMVSDDTTTAINESITGESVIEDDSSSLLLNKDFVIIGVNCVSVVGPHNYVCELCDARFDDSSRGGHLRGQAHMMNVLWNWDPESASKIRFYETVNKKVYRSKCLEAARQVELKELRLLSDHQQKVKQRLLGHNITQLNEYFEQCYSDTPVNKVSNALVNEQLARQLTECVALSNTVKQYYSGMRGERPGNTDSIVAQLAQAKHNFTLLLQQQQHHQRKRRVSDHSLNNKVSKISDNQNIDIPVIDKSVIDKSVINEPITKQQDVQQLDSSDVVQGRYDKIIVGTPSAQQPVIASVVVTKPKHSVWARLGKSTQ